RSVIRWMVMGVLVVRWEEAACGPCATGPAGSLAHGLAIVRRRGRAGKLAGCDSATAAVAITACVGAAGAASCCPRPCEGMGGLGRGAFWVVQTMAPQPASPQPLPAFAGEEQQKELAAPAAPTRQRRLTQVNAPAHVGAHAGGDGHLVPADPAA